MGQIDYLYRRGLNILIATEDLSNQFKENYGFKRKWSINCAPEFKYLKKGKT